MNYEEAKRLMRSGEKVKLPEWIGHWFMRGDKIMVCDRLGNILDTPYENDYVNRTDWEVTNGLRDFGGAIVAAKAGKKVARSGWNGSNMYAVIMPGDPEGIEANEATQKAHNIPAGTKLTFRPYWQLYTAQKDIAMWAPSGSDSLAEDWCIVE